MHAYSVRDDVLHERLDCGHPLGGDVCLRTVGGRDGVLLGKSSSHGEGPGVWVCLWKPASTMLRKRKHGVDIGF